MTSFFETDDIIEISDENILPDDSFMPKLPEEYRIKLEKDWNTWSKEHSKDILDVTDEQVKEILMRDLKFLSTMSAEEYTLYRKWYEIHRDYPDTGTQKNISKFLGLDTCGYSVLDDLKSNVWTTNSLSDYKNLKPRLIWANDGELVAKWNALRTFIHTQINNSNIGRNLYFIAEDSVTNKIIGVIAVSSDYLDLTPRDKYIGWSKEIKTHKRMINHTAVGSTICPTQPLGYNYVGGKLMALLTISNVIEDAWKKQYNDVLAGMSTTSLYSSFSQYQNLTYWTKRGHSSGSIKFEPSKEAIDTVRKWLQKNHARRYWEWYVAAEPGGMPLKRDYKQRSLAFTYSKLEIDKKFYETNHQRGIYFCPFYKNTNEYLRMEITEDKLVKRFDNNIDLLVDIWKEKYASKRINALIEQERVSSETLFYDDVIKMTWQETKEKYLKDVGR